MENNGNFAGGVELQGESGVKCGRKFKYDDAQDCSKVLEI